MNGPRCGWCYQPTASVLLTARNGGEHRAAHACPDDLSKARSWTRTAGPLQQTPLHYPAEHPALF